MTFIHTESPAEAYEREAFVEALRDSDDPADQFVGELAAATPTPDEQQWTFADQRRAFDALADKVGEWQGFPIPLPELSLRLNHHHPLRDFYGTYDEVAQRELRLDEEFEHTCKSSDLFDIVNQWWCREHACTVYVVREHESGRFRAIKHYTSPRDSMRRLDLWVRTIGASDAWDIKAEANAMEKLFGMLSGRQVRHYMLTGSFLEKSERSGVMYLFRRLRPTIAMTFKNGYTQFLTALCLHPIGYYNDTWAGCMVPSDDVIAHLTMMRGDEADFWGKANHHPARVGEAGL